MIDTARLVAAGLHPTQARLFAEPLKAALALFDMLTPARAAAVVGQCRVESRDFARLEESLYYSTPERIRAIFPSSVPSLQVAATLVRRPEALANRVYANRLGNGNEASGQGWLYRGRGLVMLTGRDNYANAEVELGRPYLAEPWRLAEPSDACLAACWFFRRNKLDILADSAQWDAITRRVNGPAMLERHLRRQYSEDALAAFA